MEIGFYDEEPLPPDPSSMGIGETNLENLSEEEIDVVRETLFIRLGVVPSDPNAQHRRYQSQAPDEATVPGEINIQVFKTNIEGLFLQEMNFADGQQRWVIGPDTNV